VPQRVTLWAQVVSGMELDADGRIHVAASRSGTAKRRQLTAIGTAGVRRKASYSRRLWGESAGCGFRGPRGNLMLWSRSRGTRSPSGNDRVAGSGGRGTMDWVKPIANASPRTRGSSWSTRAGVWEPGRSGGR
jgi:hypothetical protein